MDPDLRECMNIRVFYCCSLPGNEDLMNYSFRKREGKEEMWRHVEYESSGAIKMGCKTTGTSSGDLNM